jgi:hypothetical protein
VSSQPSGSILAVVTLVVSCGSRTGLDLPIGAGGAGEDAGDDIDGGQVGLPPIDPACTAGGGPIVFPPYVPLVPPDLPEGCSNGFELGDATDYESVPYTLDAIPAQGAAAVTLDVDFATYHEPDAVVITGTLADGETYTLLDSCRLRTSDSGDVTGGMFRPADDTIRQFRIDVRAGTASLAISFAGVVSPMYIQVLGLCEFQVTYYPYSVWWQPVP